MSTKGWFISFEGMDGAGKSSHIQSTSQWLLQSGKEVLITREPGGSPLSEKIRELVIYESMDIKVEALLMYAARVQHVVQIIEPALNQGVCVLSDRFEDSSFAYQASAGGLGDDQLLGLSKWSLNGFEPDLTLLFDLPIEESLNRIAKRNQPSDKFESKSRKYIEQVRQGFLRRAELAPDRIKIIDASESEARVWQQVMAQLKLFVQSKDQQR